MLVLVMALVASLVAVSPAPAEAAGFDPNDMAFPVGGTDFRITDSFGDCRDGCARTHEGVDIMADKGVPVYAAGDGIAEWVSATQEDCCRLQIDHGDGWSSRYIHLNNDTEDGNGGYTDDGLGWGIAPGIVDGTPITKGQLIGWVGDSGNAESTAPHLHFELRRDGVAVDSYRYLHKALGILISQFTDIADSTHRVNIDKILEDGITKGCNPPANTRFCPNSSVTRGQMAAFLVRALGLPASSTDHFDDD
ncbi:MAG TPA: M23 family metallopeptidase, partial [Acidimicrobiia bacterium]|nr:M23 family metallopeptidase [Acidimicrobiia bacterium]